MKKFTFASLAILCVIAISLASRYALRSLRQVITPHETTMTAIGETVNRIHLFTKVNGTLPNSLRDLPRRAGYTNRTTDHWGTELVYTIHEDGAITLSSLGRDETVGGSGDALDFEGVYNSADGKVEIFAGSDRWIAWNVTDG